MILTSILTSSRASTLKENTIQHTAPERLTPQALVCFPAVHDTEPAGVGWVIVNIFHLQELSGSVIMRATLHTFHQTVASQVAAIST